MDVYDFPEHSGTLHYQAFLQLFTSSKSISPNKVLLLTAYTALLLLLMLMLMLMLLFSASTFAATAALAGAAAGAISILNFEIYLFFNSVKEIWAKCLTKVQVELNFCKMHFSISATLAEHNSIEKCGTVKIN
ncbi:hypothetical protein T11_12789 [Trichinella zimbabwensis]|uniref:Uncharacterized protein n=1 Tax=Trichinella zimbabwensis TaxID=268475 RepID=A0A0V1HIG3_9BILA|nr:hypothetical protein T11_12789 [Trichinella zimbabwensis]